MWFLVVSEGQVAEVGTHSQLMEQKSQFLTSRMPASMGSHSNSGHFSKSRKTMDNSLGKLPLQFWSLQNFCIFSICQSIFPAQTKGFCCTIGQARACETAMTSIPYRCDRGSTTSSKWARKKSKSFRVKAFVFVSNETRFVFFPRLRQNPKDSMSIEHALKFCSCQPRVVQKSLCWPNRLFSRSIGCDDNSDVTKIGLILKHIGQISKL